MLEVSSYPQLDQMLASADAGTLFVIDFYADWCGPCKYIAPIFEQLSKQFNSATFLKVNVDHAPDISQHYGVRAMPTFILIKRNSVVERIEGADPYKLQNLIAKHYSNNANNTAASDMERQFLSQFVPNADKALAYGDEINRTMALSVIPSDELVAKSTSNGKVNWFILAQELLKWFKEDFFTWTDSPKCPSCDKQTPKNGLTGSPTREETELGVNRVEIYHCECGQEVRFPRYNDPVKLLETRTGRCGEWANCFTLMAFAMGFDARFVYDVTDHVWTELYIPELKRWVHCDPCENVIDKPLLYELGWNKKLSYVIAFGIDHVYDVSWRYSANHKQTLQRRKSVREPVLANFLKKLSQRVAQRSGATEERLKEVRDRRMTELIEMIVIKRSVEDEQNYGGRTTGSLDWRQARGEVGRCDTAGKPESAITLKPSKTEVEEKLFKFSYSSPSDTYSRGSESTKGWQKLTNSYRNIMYKMERDWKKSYLCREDGSNDGEITWLVDVSEVATKIKELKVTVHGMAVFENGLIGATVCIGDACFRIPKTGILAISGEDFNASSNTVKISFVLSGGQGANAFQHAQLFRSDLDDDSEHLDVSIVFN